jgi:hypothetical protein
MNKVVTALTLGYTNVKVGKLETGPWYMKGLSLTTGKPMSRFIREELAHKLLAKVKETHYEPDAPLPVMRNTEPQIVEPLTGDEDEPPRALASDSLGSRDIAPNQRLVVRTKDGRSTDDLGFVYNLATQSITGMLTDGKVTELDSAQRDLALILGLPVQNLVPKTIKDPLFTKVPTLPNPKIQEARGPLRYWSATKLPKTCGRSNGNKLYCTRTPVHAYGKRCPHHWASYMKKHPGAATLLK